MSEQTSQEFDPSGDSGAQVPADSLPTVDGGDDVEEPLETQSPADEPDEVADQSPVPDDGGLDEEGDDGNGQADDAAEPTS
jgi:hypothetical protein